MLLYYITYEEESVLKPSRENRIMSLDTCKYCDRVTEPDSEFCSSHGGKSNYTFNSDRIRNAVSRKQHSDTLFSLREEVGLMRHVIESTINNNSDDESALAAISGLVTSQVETLSRILTSCQKLEIVSSTVMSIEEVNVLCSDIASIISDHVDDVEVVKSIATAIDDRLEELKEDQREKVNGDI